MISQEFRPEFTLVSRSIQLKYSHHESDVKVTLKYKGPNVFFLPYKSIFAIKKLRECSNCRSNRLMINDLANPRIKNFTCHNCITRFGNSYGDSSFKSNLA